MLQNNFLTSVPANKIELLRTMHNAPYVHPSLDSILDSDICLSEGQSVIRLRNGVWYYNPQTTFSDLALLLKLVHK